MRAWPPPARALSRRSSSLSMMSAMSDSRDQGSGIRNQGPVS
jgi:hypothetical protein